jgi:flagellar assembly protein FliH
MSLSKPSPLSKIYQNTAEFVPEQLLPNHQGHPEPVWQELMPGHSSPGQGQGGFTPDRADKHEQTVSRQTTALPAEDHADAELNEETPAPGIDLELIRQEGITEGVLKGRQQADDDFGTSVRTLQAACEQLTRLHETILRNNTHEMHTMVMAIAEKVIRHSLSSEQNQTILATIEDAIRFAVKSEEFEIRVNPKDLEIIKHKKQDIINDISGLNNITLKADNSIERGGCRLESANCTVDATIGSQLQVIQEALQANQTTQAPA